MAARGPGDGAVRVRLRPVRVLPGRPGPGVPAADPARVHRTGIVRRVRSRARGRREPGRAAAVGGLGDRGLPGLPVRHRVPRGDRAWPDPARPMAGRARLRRGRPVGGPDRGGTRGPGSGRRRVSSGPGAGRRAGCGSNRGRPFGRSGCRGGRHHRGRGGCVARRPRVTGDRSQLGPVPAPARAARAGRAAAGRADPGPYGPGRGAGTRDLRIARHGRWRLPGHDGDGGRRHAAARPADRESDWLGRCWPGAGGHGRAGRAGRRDHGSEAVTGKARGAGRRAGRCRRPGACPGPGADRRGR